MTTGTKKKTKAARRRGRLRARPAERRQVPTNFPEKLKRRCEEVGMPAQKDLADRLGGLVSRATVSRWFCGLATPDMYQATALAQVLDVPVEFLADDRLKEPPPAIRTDVEKDYWWMGRQLGMENAIRVLYRSVVADRAQLIARDPDAVAELGTTYADVQQARRLGA